MSCSFDGSDLLLRPGAGETIDEKNRRGCNRDLGQRRLTRHRFAATIWSHAELTTNRVQLRAGESRPTWTQNGEAAAVTSFLLELNPDQEGHELSPRPRLSAGVCGAEHVGARAIGFNGSRCSTLFANGSPLVAFEFYLLL
ncbi:unnamed protein product [Ectocarpus sp. 12 AP-2014]